MNTENDMMRRFVAWGEGHESVRAIINTSTRTNPNAPVDVFSDYDVILAVNDVQPFFEDRSWLYDFGPMLVVYRDPITPVHGFGVAAYITQYEDGLKIDFTLSPVGLVRHMADEAQRTGHLDDVLDVGYTVWLDKDGLTKGLIPPTYRAHIPARPTEEEYLTEIEVFFHEATYMAKHLWRDELMPAKFHLDHMMKYYNFRRILEWRIEIDHNWSIKPGAHGKFLKKRLSPEFWAEFERTYVGPGEEENWDAMFRTIDLFRKVAIEVADALGYAYPHDLHRRVIAYLQKVKALDRGATTLNF